MTVMDLCPTWLHLKHLSILGLTSGFVLGLAMNGLGFFFGFVADQPQSVEVGY